MPSFLFSRSFEFGKEPEENGNIKERIEGIIFADEFDEKIKPLLKSETEK